ncbi:MAG: hypothetical protein JOZ18_05935, partial [Chloroflexi bacterium]|nr:hypothetical protein [Chloroflexota bacterium]
MGFEYMGPLPDPDADRYEQVPTQKLPDPAKTDDDRLSAKNSALPEEDHTQPLRLPSKPRSPSNELEYYQEPSYREHVSGSLVLHPADAPYFRPAYQAYQPPAQQQQQAEQPSPPIPPYQPTLAFPGYPPPAAQAQTTQNNNAYQHGGYSLYAPYPGYPPYPYPYTWQPEQPKRDSYLLTISIASFIGAILVILVGIGSTLILLFMATFPNMRGLPASQQFSGIVAFTAFAGACLVGGSFSLYHSIRSLFFRRPSADFKLPWFWIFLALYAVVIAVASALRYNGQAISNIPLTVFLIALAGLLPAITIVALGVRRLHYPREARWPTSWRRFTLALVSGMTSAIVFAAIFEFALTLLVSRGMGLPALSIDNPNQPLPQNPRAI